MKTKQYIGHWWTQNVPTKFYGTLTISEKDGYILETIGGLFISDEVLMILGIAVELDTHKEFTFQLLHCIVIRSNFNKLKNQKILASYFLRSSSKEINNSLEFNSINLSPKNIGNWANMSNFTFSPKNGDFELGYKMPQALNLFENDVFRIQLNFASKYGFEKPQKFIAVQSSYITIDYFASQSLQEIQNHIRLIQDFFTLAIDHPSYFEKIVLRKKGNDSKRYIDYSFFRKNRYRDKRYKKIHQSEMLFTLNNISNSKQSIFQKWIENYDSLKYVLNNFFGTVYNDYLYEENSFLDCVFALEVFHKIENSKRIYLSKRLKKIIEFHKSCFLDIFNPSDLFVDKVVETRHALVHHVVKKPEMVIRDEFELYSFTEKLSVIIKAVLMKKMGFDDHIINQSLKRSINGKVIFKM